MPFKSGSYCSSMRSSLWIPFIGVLFAGSAQAALTVTSISAGKSVGAAAYYTMLGASGLSATAFMDTTAQVDTRYVYTFGTVDVAATLTTAAESSNGRANMLRFRVDVDRTLP